MYGLQGVVTVIWLETLDQQVNGLDLRQGAQRSDDLAHGHALLLGRAAAFEKFGRQVERAHAACQLEGQNFRALRDGVFQPVFALERQQGLQHTLHAAGALSERELHRHLRQQRHRVAGQAERDVQRSVQCRHIDHALVACKAVLQLQHIQPLQGCARDPEIHGLNLRQLCQRIHNGVDGQPLRVPAARHPRQELRGEIDGANAVFYTDAAQCRALGNGALAFRQGQQAAHDLRGPVGRIHGGDGLRFAHEVALRLVRHIEHELLLLLLHAVVTQQDILGGQHIGRAVAAAQNAHALHTGQLQERPGKAGVENGAVEAPARHAGKDQLRRALGQANGLQRPVCGQGSAQLRRGGPLQVLQHDGAQTGVWLERRGLGADHAVLAAIGDLGAAVVEGKRGVRLLCGRGGAGAQQRKREQQKQQASHVSSSSRSKCGNRTVKIVPPPGRACTVMVP